MKYEKILTLKPSSTSDTQPFLYSSERIFILLFCPSFHSAFRPKNTEFIANLQKYDKIIKN